MAYEPERKPTMTNITSSSTTSTTIKTTTFFACDHIGKRIYGSEVNFKKAEIFETAQYKALMVLMERHPNYALDAIAPAVAKQSYKGLNFELMMDYVEFKGTAVQKAEFEEIVNRDSSFPVIKSWFVENFKAGFTVEKAKHEIATAKNNAKKMAAKESLKAQKAAVRKVVKTNMAKVAPAVMELPSASNF